MALTGREVCRSRGAAGRRQRLPVSVNGLQMDSRIHLGAGGGCQRDLLNKHLLGPCCAKCISSCVVFIGGQTGRGHRQGAYVLVRGREESRIAPEVSV